VRIAFYFPCLALLTSLGSELILVHGEIASKQQVDAWKRQTANLATAYLQWKCSGDPAPEIDGQELWTIEIMSFTCSYAFPPTFRTP
jgi:hypothetical protein